MSRKKWLCLTHIVPSLIQGEPEFRPSGDVPQRGRFVLAQKGCWFLLCSYENKEKKASLSVYTVLETGTTWLAASLGLNPTPSSLARRV